MAKKNDIIPAMPIENKIYVFRGQKVMLDSDLAELYNVETRVLNQAVKRNSDRFPEDFMFQLSKKEFEILKSQNVISSWGGRWHHYAGKCFKKPDGYRSKYTDSESICEI